MMTDPAHKPEKEKEQAPDKTAPEPPKPAPDADTAPEDEGDFNFGGLPQRDLKKNLGCG